MNMILVISPKGQLRFMVAPKRIGTPVFVEFLKRLMHDWKRPIFIIVDRHQTHKARVVTACVVKMKGQLRIFSLPPYSTEPNPDEYVWNN